MSGRDYNPEKPSSGAPQSPSCMVNPLPDNEDWIDVANRDYHYLSRFEIDGGKRISQHLANFLPGLIKDYLQVADNAETIACGSMTVCGRALPVAIFHAQVR